MAYMAKSLLEYAERPRCACMRVLSERGAVDGGRWTVDGGRGIVKGGWPYVTRVHILPSGFKKLRVYQIHRLIRLLIDVDVRCNFARVFHIVAMRHPLSFGHQSRWC